MIQDLTITDFRGFKTFSMTDLGRVNLLVGTNNCGKTSILEAIEMLMSRGDLHTLWSALSRRGERQVATDGNDAEVSHLFRGHAAEPGTTFEITAKIDDRTNAIKAEISDAPSTQPQPSLPFQDDSEFSIGLWLNLYWNSQPTTQVPLKSGGGINSSLVRRLRSVRDLGALSPTTFITTASLSTDEVISLFSEVVLTPDESLVIEALRTIEPTIERIASTSVSGRNYSKRGGIVIKHANIDQRVPIGSVGDGIWRMLGLALALVRSENGILLVDEIDTGLHFTVMSQMWKLLSDTAARLNVQVFATTHSRDCYESLASIIPSSIAPQHHVTIQRIERDRCQAVAFSDAEIGIAAERGIEVR